MDVDVATSVCLCFSWRWATTPSQEVWTRWQRNVPTWRTWTWAGTRSKSWAPSRFWWVHVSTAALRVHRYNWTGERSSQLILLPAVLLKRSSTITPIQHFKVKAHQHFIGQKPWISYQCFYCETLSGSPMEGSAHTASISIQVCWFDVTL